MIKTEIIGFCQKINRIIKLVELSVTLTQKWRITIFVNETKCIFEKNLKKNNLQK
jgi:hypothetical protein